MIDTKRTYMSPEGEVVEATSHEFAIRLKGLGYTRTEDAPSREAVPTEQAENTEQVEPEVEHQVETPEAVSADAALNETVRTEDVRATRGRGR